MIGGTIAAETWLPVLIEAGTTQMGDVDSDAFEAVPRELAVKAERSSSEITPKAVLTAFRRGWFSVRRS